VDVEAGSFVGRSNLAMSYGREAEGLAGRGDAAGARACYERAAELAEGAVAVNPEFADARRRAATYGFAVGQDLRAVGHLEALIAMGEGRPGVVKDLDEIRSWAAGAWAKMGRYDRAAGHYEVLARSSMGFGAFAGRGVAVVRARMPEAAVEVGEDGRVR
jgi:tetratricopeptide (TPR) repeat protein